MEKTLEFLESSGKRAKLRDWILNEIRSGRLKPGDTAPTRFALAKNFDCSRATADHVIKNLIKDNILVATQGKGTFVAESRERTQVDAVALINCNPTFAWAAEIEEAFVMAMNGGTRVVRFSAQDLRLPMNWKECLKHKVLVFVMPETHHGHFLYELRQTGSPHLAVYRDPPESPFINIDHRAAGRNMVAALKEKGCTRPAWVSRTESRFKTPEERYAGFLEGLLEQGIPFRKEWAGFFAVYEEADYLRSLFAGPEKPDSLVLAQASMGVALKVILEAGLAPGKDILIASMDEVKEGTYSFPVLCTEKLTEKIGKEAARIVQKGENLSNGRPYRQFLIPEVTEK